MPVLEEKGPVEFVAVVEATANMISHWDIIKKQYLLPALQHFHHQSKISDEFITNMSGNRYGLVLYHAADHAPDLTTDCITPTRNIGSYLKMLDSINFNGGDQYSFIAEGLATALQLFSDFKLSQRNNDVRKFCFLISNTPPYQMPSAESVNYNGLTCHQLAESLKDMNVKLSVICPRLIAELHQIYLANNTQPPLMNYAQDRRHLVLISGFRFQTEKEPVPMQEVSQEGKLTPSVLNDPPTPMEMPVINSVEVPPLAAETIIGSNGSENTGSFPQHTNTTQPNPVATAQVVMITTPTVPPASQNLITATATFTSNSFSNQNVSQSFLSSPSTATGNTFLNVRPMPNPTTNIPASVTLNTIIPAANITENNMHISKLPVTGIPPPSTGNTIARDITAANPSNVSSGMVPVSPSTQPQYVEAQKEAAKVLMIAQNQQPPSSSQLWSGTLEWIEKRKPPGPNMQPTKINYILQCTVCRVPSHPIVDTSSWPKKLIMQMIPQQFINGMVQTCLKPNKKVFFRFQPANLSQDLSSHMQKQTCGLINMNTLSQTQVSIIVIYMKNKDNSNTKENQFCGIIPNDATAFMNALKQVIVSARGGGQIVQRQVVGPNAIPQSQSGGMQPGRSNLSNQPSNTGVMQHQPPRQHIVQQRSFPNQSNTGMQQVGISTSQPTRMIQQINATGMQQRMVPNPTQPVRVTRVNTGNIPYGQPGVNRGGTSNMQMGVGNMTPGSGNAILSGGQRILSSEISMPGGNKGNVIQIPHMRSISRMQVSRPIGQEQQQSLRNLLGSNNNTMQQQGTMNIRQQESAGMRPAAPNNMQQQQNFMQRGNMMNNMQQNQRHY